MKLQTNLSLRHEQRLLLLPKMLQSIEILQLATQDLLQLIDAEVEQNETLEASAPAVERPTDPAVKGRAEREDDPDWRALRTNPAAPEERDHKLDLLANLAAGAATLVDSVKEQLAWLDLPAGLAQSVLALAERLDARGLLVDADEELAAVVASDALVEAIRVLQCLEPRGIGARDPIGAMLLQVDPEDPDYRDIAALLTVHLEALAKNRIPAVAKALGRSVEEVQALVARIRTLNPHPGAGFARDEAAGIRPDVVARLVDGKLEILVEDQDLPSLGISEHYAALARERGVAREVKQYLRQKLAAARGLISAVEQRRRTLGRVARATLERQRAFLERGRSAIQPLKMSEVAEELGLHVSTVSRAIAGKHVQTDRGVLALREFFDGGGVACHDAPTTGRAGVKQQIADLIAAEDRAQPLSDDDIVDRLAASGIRVARRTVAKYRKDLDIPTCWLRKSHG